MFFNNKCNFTPIIKLVIYNYKQMKRLIILLALVVFSSSIIMGSDPISAQENLASKRKEAVDSYVEFVNESIHGLLIVNRLLQGYNEDINKYVDLDEYQLNNISNKHLPRDIFEDDEKWFYETSPNQWYTSLNEKSDVFSNIEASELKSYASTLNKINGDLNQLRFDIEDLIGAVDLEKRENIGLVYQKLEEGTTLYKSFFATQMDLEKTLNKVTEHWVPSSDTKDIIAILDNVYQSSKDILLQIRTAPDSDISTLLEGQRNALQAMQNFNIDAYQNSSSKLKRAWKNTIDQLDKSVDAATKYNTTGEVIPEFKYYGKDYFYYNSEIIGRFNKYGLGIVQEMNRILNILGQEKLNYLELPHQFKVIYPNKVENIDYVFAKKGMISSLPKVLMDRNIKPITKEKIIAEDKFIELSFYDHFIEDGDVVSINFNGEWIAKEMPLTQEPKVIKVLLNHTGKNYITLHAENLGKRPPNTMAISYKLNNTVKEVVLNSDMNASELIEIVYKNN